MYQALVRARVRSVWRRIEGGQWRAATGMAAPHIAFHFVGDTPLSARFTSAEEFERWFAAVFAFLPGVRLRLVDVVASGPPYRTTVAVRLTLEARLADGTLYRNQAVQWARLRWGRLVFDEILFDTKRLEAACRVQLAAGLTPPTPPTLLRPPARLTAARRPAPPPDRPGR